MTEPFQSDHNSNFEDAQLKQLLNTLEIDAAPVDHDALARIRELSLQTLAAAQADAASSRSAGETQQARRADTHTTAGLAANQTRTSGPSLQPSPPQVQRSVRRPEMLTLAARAVVTVTALIVGGMAWFLAGVNADADMTLGSVIDRTQQSASLQLKILRNGKTADVWIREGGRLRWQDSATRYQVADGTSLWEVDEDANLARPSHDPELAAAADNPDLLAFLGIGPDGIHTLRQATASETVRHNGTRCRVYRAEATVDGRPLRFEAYVEDRTHELQSIVAWPANADKRTGPPVAELRLVARNTEIEESQFELSGALSEDGRIGKITDHQGIVLLRPKLNRRWTPVCGPLRLKPGDQLRTDVRGANAVAVHLTSGATLTVGPATLVELITPQRIRLHYGEMQIASDQRAELTLLGPQDQTVALVLSPEGTREVLYRLDRNERLMTLPKKPQWLLGFEGASTNESIGSLIANVDGRDVPLTIGYHRVQVEIRDQIARTTIEESFVNRTRQRLEGVFHFPLPQDASISGFGMWINGELIEADVVEKQRAREIYETILRERRDPALLEWAGGNIFKARVFPIEPRSEKRIKIVYTQVLPLRANQYRYAYALRSELLQKTPLRELAIDVLVNSALPLKSVDSPTHPVRIEQTDGAARIQFSAQEYSPTRDFELVCEIDGRASDVVTIPHRRGEDGYFMVQLMPPSVEGNWQREILPDGAPLEVLLVCDTSGSMDQANRRTQADFVAAVLASLGSEDRFNIAVCDVDCRWLFEAPVPAGSQSAARARAWLDERKSLGWTDLDAAFASIQKHARPESQVIYLGDGIVSARDVDAQGFAARLRRMFEKNSHGTFHAVSTGNRFESVVLKAIASIGRGSVRAIGSGQTPTSVALELLNEMAQPGLRDLEVEFRGIPVAAVYPEQLPNLAAGTQQILIGRYLPSGDAQTGEIVVTGTRGGERVRYSARIPLRDAEHGNSFIPRLWARAHLDHLLQQGRSQPIQDEIIALSEEFHIITPYTSLLVLETDEDRERFGVKRRVRMRDGERFFAEGAEDANYELKQQVLREAGNWRLQLRDAVLRQLAELGRDPKSLQQLQRLLDRARQDVELAMRLSEAGPLNQVARQVAGSDWYFEDDRSAGGSGGFGGYGGFVGDANTLPMLKKREVVDGFEAILTADETHPFGEDADGLSSLSDFRDTPLPLGESRANLDLGAFAVGSRGRDENLFGFYAGFERSSRRSKPALGDREAFGAGAFGPLQTTLGLAVRDSRAGEFAENFVRFDQIGTPDYTAWLRVLFPSLPAPRLDAEGPDRESDWPLDAIEISESLLRNTWLKEYPDGLEIRRITDTYDPLWERHTGHSEHLQLYSRDAWVSWQGTPGSGRTLSWFDAQQRGVLLTTFGLGRVRPSVPQDRMESIDVGAYAFGRGLHHAFNHHDVQVQDVDGNPQLLIVDRNNRQERQRITIDDEMRVITRIEYFSGETVTATRTFSDFLELRDAWWPQRSETRDGDGHVTSRSRTALVPLDAQAFAERLEGELAVREQAALLTHPLPGIAEAELADADGSADFADHLVLIVRSARIQQWDVVLAQFEKLAVLLRDTPARSWIHLELLKAARRNAEALDLIHLLAGRLSDDDAAELAHARHLVDCASSITDANEMLGLLAQLKPVYERQPDYTGASWEWMEHRIRALRSLNRLAEMLELERTAAEGQPWDIYLQTQYARDLAAAGEIEAAYAWLKALTQQAAYERPSNERNQVWQVWSTLLQERGQSHALLEVVEQWMQDEPEGEQAYERYLSVLAMEGRVDDARTTVLDWMEAGRIPGRLSPALAARTGAAIDYALGQGWGIYADNVDPEWLEPLKTMALFFMTHEHQFDFTRRIMDRAQFSNTDAADAVRVQMFAELERDAATLEAERVAAFVRWLLDGPPQWSQQAWQPVAQTLRDRWETLEHSDRAAQLNPPADEKRILGDALSRLYAHSFRDNQYVPFLRARLAQASAEQRGERVDQLLNVLTAEPWSEETEAECFDLLNELSGTESTPRLALQVPAACRVVDRMLEARVQTAERELQDTGHPETLTRQELAARKAEFLQAARAGLAARLAAEAEEADGLLGQWLQMERMFLQVRLSRNLDRVADRCRELLGPRPPAGQETNGTGDTNDAAAPADQPAPEQPTRAELLQRAAEEAVGRLLRERALVTVANLAVRKSAAPELRERLLEYVDAGIDEGGKTSAVWKRVKAHLLIALNRPQELEQQLREWIREEESDTAWRSMLAKLVAERGEFRDAIRLFESLEDDTQLAPADYAILASWYLAEGQRDEYERAKIESLKVAHEYQLANFVRQHRYRWERTDVPLPSELDEQVLFAFQALFAKSSSPGSYLYELNAFYKASRDFRFLRMLPDSVIGRTPQQVYGFLEQLQAAVLNDVHQEATLDEIAVRIETLRQRELTALDRRALDLLEALLERRAAEVLNQPGPHVEAALAALQRAFEREWGEGERRQMAQFLNALGRLHQSELANEQIRQLEMLYVQEDPGTDDRLFVGWHLASALSRPDGRQDDGLQRMETVIREYDQAHPGGWPSQSNPPFAGYVEMLENSHRHAQAEAFVKRHLENPLNSGQHDWLVQQLVGVYASALENETRVSLGEGVDLYQKLLTFIVKQAEGLDDNRRYNILRLIHGVFRTAHRKDFPTLRDDLRAYAFETLPRLLNQQQNHYHSMIQQTADLLQELHETRTALEFLIERIEHYPRWMCFTWQNPWNRFGYRLGDWREDLGDRLGDLEPRLLSLVLAELRRDLQTRNPRGRYLYSRHSHFWPEKEADFASVAEDVLAEHRGSARYVEHIASYLFQDLEHRERAIEVLFVAHRDGLLDDSRQAQLVDWLHHPAVKRYAESIAILEGLVERHSLNMAYRCELLTAYHHTQRTEQRERLYAETVERFREGGRWNEANLSALAECLHQLALDQRTVELLGELIPLHQRNHPTRGIGDGTLSTYYMWLADAHARLKHTGAAIDAAAGAIVSWGPQHEQRRAAVSKLEDVTARAEDLDQYVRQLDADAEETGRDSPLIRRAIGKAYAARNAHRKAIAQWQIAADLQPADLETHRLLLAAYDQLEDREGAIEQLRTLIDRDPHTLSHYGQLYERLRDDPVQAERAATAVVEAAPNEAEHHAQLARIREQNEQYEAAVLHWKQVAALRSLEPDGLIHLAEAQIRAGAREAAEGTLAQLRTTAWPARFEQTVQAALEKLGRLLQDG